MVAPLGISLPPRLLLLQKVIPGLTGVLDGTAPLVVRLASVALAREVNVTVVELDHDRSIVPVQDVTPPIVEPFHIIEGLLQKAEGLFCRRIIAKWPITSHIVTTQPIPAAAVVMLMTNADPEISPLGFGWLTRSLDLMVKLFQSLDQNVARIEGLAPEVADLLGSKGVIELAIFLVLLAYSITDSNSPSSERYLDLGGFFVESCADK
jgi:hypothetical protein